MGRLTGQVAVITGATSGIGEATARLFAREEACVVVAGRDERRGAAIAADLGDTGVFHRADVTREAEVGAWCGSPSTGSGGWTACSATPARWCTTTWTP